jgi:hypothetical protein
MVADPMFLAVNPEIVPESYLTGAGVWAVAATQNPYRKITAAMERTREKRQRAIIIMKFLSRYRIRWK